MPVLKNDQQIELDAFLAENEKMLSCFIYKTTAENEAYVAGYNEGSKAAAEAIRQNNWTWEEYEEHRDKLTRDNGGD